GRYRSERPASAACTLDTSPAVGIASQPQKEDSMKGRLIARSAAIGALLLTAGAGLGAGRVHAQWNTSPQAQPVECASWQTAYGGGLCREEHFNQTTTGNSRAATSVRVPSGVPAISPNGQTTGPRGTGLTGINTGTNTNASPITSGSEAGGGGSSNGSGD